MTFAQQSTALFHLEHRSAAQKKGLDLLDPGFSAAVKLSGFY